MTIGRRVKIVQEDSPYREGGMTAEQLRWFPVTEFNWSLREADALSVVDLAEYFEMKDGYLKGQAFLARKRKPSSR